MATNERLRLDLDSDRFRHGLDQGFWRLDALVGDVVCVWLTAADDVEYLFELDCQGYGDQAIRGRFLEPTTRNCQASGWPQGNAIFEAHVKFKGNDHFICWDQDREGIRRHNEWAARRAWRKSPNQALAYLDFMRRLLHLGAYGYQRREAA